MQAFDNTGYLKVTTVRRSLIVSILIRLLRMLYLGIVLAPLIVLSIYILTKINNHLLQTLPTFFILLIPTVYLFYCFIFFIKGLMIALRTLQKKGWLIVFAILLIITCGLQFITCYLYLIDAPALAHFTNPKLFSFLISSTLAFTIAHHFRLLQNISPSITFWAYKAGFNTIVGRLPHEKPERTYDLLTGTVMKISYRRTE